MEREGRSSNTEEIIGSGRNMRGYVLAYSRLKRENICQLWLLNRLDLNFCVRRTRLRVRRLGRAAGTIGRTNGRRRRRKSTLQFLHSHRPGKHGAAWTPQEPPAENSPKTNRFRITHNARERGRDIFSTTKHSSTRILNDPN